MMKFFEIPKNAHDSTFFLTDFYQMPEEVNVVILRDPMKRFWSACKTNTAELSPFGNWPTYTPEEFRNAPTSYGEVSSTPAQVINAIKQKMQSGDLSIHLQTQVSHIGDAKFDHVIKVESLRQDLDNLSDLYGFDRIPDELYPHTHSSVKDWDEEALAIILNDDYIQTFYSADTDLYNNPAPLLEKFTPPEVVGIEE